MTEHVQYYYTDIELKCKHGPECTHWGKDFAHYCAICKNNLERKSLKRDYFIDERD